MTSIQAYYDGAVFRPEGPVDVPRDARVRLVVVEREPGKRRKKRPAKKLRPEYPRIRKLPRLIQAHIDHLLDKAERYELSPSERRLLTEVLDYVDELTLRSLEAFATR